MLVADRAWRRSESNEQRQLVRHNPHICKFRLMHHFSTALQWTFVGSKNRSITDIVDTIRLLAQTQELFSTTDVEDCASYYCGQPEGVKLLLSQQCELEDGPAQGVALSSAHYFAAAVRNYGIGNRAWEPLIRRFIREGVDIHDRVNPRYDPYLRFDAQITNDMSDTGNFWEYGTPLDKLFEDSRDPSESKESADAWLHILSDEGFNLQAYLMEEAAIHATQNQLTWEDSMSSRCRRLCYETGETPSVWWEWCPSPLSRIPLVQAEYGQISFDLGDGDLGFHYPVSWQDRWPFDHLEWSDDLRMWEAPPYYIRDWKRSSEWWQQYVLAQERAERRFAKRARKLARGQERRTRSQMPGTWIE